jgi:hypothetical protein
MIPGMKGTTLQLIMLRLLLLLMVCGMPAFAGTLSIAEYRQQLSDLSSQTESLKNQPEDSEKLLASIPDHVSVRAHSQEYSVSYQWLKDDLAKFKKAEAVTRTGILQGIQQHLRILDSESRTFENGSGDLEQSRRKLDEILSRHEFRKVQGPSAGAILWAKIYRFLSRFFRVGYRAKMALDFLQVLVYLLIGAAVVAVAIWVIRRLSAPQEELDGRSVMPFAPSAKGWRSWLAEARTLAQRGDWRNSIHLAYWAGISFLEENGAWKPDRARTPREYLRLLGTRTPQYPVLTRLTRKFEIVWYGHRDAGEADFQEILGQLEQLGCR